MALGTSMVMLGENVGWIDFAPMGAEFLSIQPPEYLVVIAWEKISVGLTWANGKNAQDFVA